MTTLDEALQIAPLDPKVMLDIIAREPATPIPKILLEKGCCQKMMEAAVIVDTALKKWIPLFKRCGWTLEPTYNSRFGEDWTYTHVAEELEKKLPKKALELFNDSGWELWEAVMDKMAIDSYVFCALFGAVEHIADGCVEFTTDS